MGLEEGFIETAYKGGGKIRIDRPCEQRFKKRKTGGFEGGKNTEPFLFRSQSFSTVERRRKYSAMTRRMKNRP